MHSLLEAVREVVLRAGAAVAEVYAREFAVRGKADASPVTAADERAEAIIVPALQALTPGLAIVAEEAVAATGVPTCGARFWLVDPLDGTREFVQRNGEFTVNIALVDDGVPVLGAVLAPALGRLFLGAAGGGACEESGGTRRALACRPLPPPGPTLLASRSHDDAHALAAWLGARRPAAVRRLGSSLKLALLAAGEADLYPRFGRTMGWDIAAGHAVLAAAGGDVARLDGRPLRYAAPFENPDFVAGSADALAWAGLR
ncbi:MAG TPA: 3'(2'),5'-bisphosphate nucleotidase CysQ [Gemmatimonadales bacterium]|nr:3'(2'),5'-bisphosphate nucleotidase CysQ [Gemmatimonadales bacterium]